MIYLITDLSNLAHTSYLNCSFYNLIFLQQKKKKKGEQKNFDEAKKKIPLVSGNAGVEKKLHSGGAKKYFFDESN